MSSAQEIAKFKNEGKNATADIGDIGAGFANIAVKQGVTQPYKTSYWEEVPEWAKDKNGHWMLAYTGTIAFIVDKDKIPEKDIPRSWEALKNSKFKVSPGDVGTAAQASSAVLAAAKLEGKAVGIVATSEVLHATPADFTTHSIHRNNYSVIGEQQVHQNLNVVFGGGKSYLKKDNATEANSKKRTDGEDMLEALQANGYNIVQTLDEMKSLNKDFVWGLFAEKDIPYDLDRDKATTPSLAEMTEKAIELLSKDKDGFFLMVEGSKVDWAGHANNPIAITSEYAAFDKAVGVALDYAKKNSDTLVVAVTDHGTGGLSIGNLKTSYNYPELPVDVFTKDMKKAKFTEVLTAEKISKDKANAKSLAKEMLGLDLTNEELNTIEKAQKTSEIETILGKVMSDRAHLGWTTNGHTGEDVPLYVYTSNYANQLTGTVNNSDVAQYIAKAMNLDLDKATDELFVSGKKIKDMGIELDVDSTNKFQPIFKLSKNGKQYTFHENKNYYEIAGKKVKFNGIVVFNGKEVFIPNAAIKDIK